MPFGDVTFHAESSKREMNGWVLGCKADFLPGAAIVFHSLVARHLGQTHLPTTFRLLKSNKSEQKKNLETLATEATSATNNEECPEVCGQWGFRVSNNGAEGEGQGKEWIQGKIILE